MISIRTLLLAGAATLAAGALVPAIPATATEATPAMTPPCR